MRRSVGCWASYVRCARDESTRCTQKHGAWKAVVGYQHSENRMTH
jgi:hypothetical protein